MSLHHQMFLQYLREVADFSPREFDSYRAPLIERLLDHVWREVPLYRDRLAPLSQDGVFDIRRWTDLPLLRSADIAGLGENLAAQQLPAEAATEEAVEPNSFAPLPRRSNVSRIAAECERERFYERVGIDSDAPLAVLHPDHADAAERGKGWSITFPNSEWVRGDVAAPAEAQAEWLAATGHDRLRTTRRLAEALAGTGAELRLSTLIIDDDELPDVQRERLSERFGARIAHLVERPVIGPCAAGFDPDGGYEVPAACMIVEVADPDGRPVPPGESGELVVTPLYEYVCPLLRLATGLAVRAPAEPGTMLGVRMLGGVVPVSG